MIKAIGGDGIPVELFQILKDDAVKVLHSLWQMANMENSAVGTGLERSVFIPIPKKGNRKECSNYCPVALISHTSKVMLKVLQARLQQYVNWELPDVQAGFRKGRGNRDQIASICWSIQKAREFRKTSTSALLTTPNPLTVWITTKCGKFLKRWEYQTISRASWETCMQIKKATVRIGHGTTDRIQTGRAVHHGCIFSSCSFNSVQSTSYEMLGWMKQKLESRLLGEILITSDMQMTPLLW